MRKPLLSYALPTVLWYGENYGVGVYVLTDRDRRRALLNRHYDEHRCPGGIVHCPEGAALWEALHPFDRVAVSGQA